MEDSNFKAKTSKKPLAQFNTKFNNAKPVRVELSAKKHGTPLSGESKQQLTTQEKGFLKPLENRKILGSKFENFEFDPETDQFGRFC